MVCVMTVVAALFIPVAVIWYMCATAPVGYEDETGFHEGEPSVSTTTD